MARMTVKGLEDFSTMIVALGQKGHEVLSAALYAGAGVLADAVKQAVSSLPEEDWRFVTPGWKKLGVLTPSEKSDLVNAVGIAKFKSDGGKTDTAIGFDGYSSRPTKKYTQGVPLAMIARSIESGSSVRQKHPFMRQAANAASSRAQQAMQDAAYQKIDEITR